MTHRSLRARVGAEDGAVVIHVGIALLSVTVLSALVVDYGMQLVSHAQVQNTVDAAALAGATALAFDGFADVSAGGPASQAVMAVAEHNGVWGEAPSALTTDVDYPVCPDAFEEPKTASGDPIITCVRVASYRDEDHGNPVATLFASLFKLFSIDSAASFGVASQAIGEAASANATTCLAPIAVPDKWLEQTASPDTFNFFDAGGAPLAVADEYFAPNLSSSPVYGVTVSGDFGARVTLQPGTLANPIGIWTYLPLQIPASKFGNDVRLNTKDCAGAASLVTLRHSDVDVTLLDFAPGDIATNEQHIAEGAEDRVQLDPDAVWNEATGRVDNSCAEDEMPCRSMSPRIMAIALYNPVALAFAIHDGTATKLEITNIVGFFIDSVDPVTHAITGYITRYPGLHDDAAVTFHEDSSFLRTSRLVQ